MKTIVWVEKNKEYAEICIERANLSGAVNVVLFSRYMDALTYLKDPNNRVDLIISNFLEYLWIDILFLGLKWRELPSAVDFFKEAAIIRRDIPFILFSSMTALDADLGKMLAEKKFNYVHKNNFQEFERLVCFFIKEI